MDFYEEERYWEEKEADSIVMEPAALLSQMERFILGHNTCALATGAGEFVRCTPIEYTYMDGCFWLLTEGGLKFRALRENKQVCLAIFDPYQGFASVAGMQVSGSAEMVKPWSEAYLRLLKQKGLSPDALKKQPRALRLIKIKPSRIDFLNAAFKELGVSTRQHLLF